MLIETPLTNPPVDTQSDQPIAISVRNVSKMYRIYERPQDRLKQMLLWRFGRNYGREFWAVRDVTFEVRKGETVGIIGRNGSGKSTLLQMIAGTLAPTEGEIRVNGRVAALLELGSGFNPEFTGRENVFLNGAILGISRDEMEARFDKIVAFADIGDFIDQPVKTYSSGMTLRLAFAVGVHVEPDLLIIDEALSVGDIRFQKKCIQRMEQLRDTGVTILFVSHDAHLIERFCTRGIVMDFGHMVASGDTVASMSYYQNLMLGDLTNTTSATAPVETTYATGEVELISIELRGEDGLAKRIFVTDESMIVSMRYQLREPLSAMYFGISVWADNVTRVGQAHSVFMVQTPMLIPNTDEIVVECRIPKLNLMPGTYYLRGGVYDKNIHFAYCLWGWAQHSLGLFSVASSAINGFVLKSTLGYALIPSEWRITQEFE